MIQRPNNRKPQKGIGVKNLTANAPVRIGRQAGTKRAGTRMDQGGQITGAARAIRQVS